MAYPPETHSGAVTSWIALTTSWPLSTPCSTYFRLDGPSLVAFDPAYGLDVDTDAACLPPAVTTWWDQAALGAGTQAHTAVSIGPLTCPDGWATVETYVKNSRSTQAMCCPNGYYIEGESDGDSVDGNCLSTVDSGTVLTYGSTSALDSDDWSIATTTLRSASTVGAIAVVGWNIAQTTSVSSTSTASWTTSTPSLTSSPTPTSATSSAPLSIQSTSASSSNDGLPTGTAAGIGVGVAVGAIGAIALIAALLMVRKRRKAQSRDATPAEVGPPGYSDHVYQGQVGIYSSEAAKQNQSAQRRSELPGDRETGELDATTAPVELEGNQGVSRR
ncbi:hypothetical protein EJ03DRAFT_392198 [Teratosphaeria nubilosa]|uniref:Uncharacterized protein n=1 Tax=Teratosphaeria nubilosa TaxID=161662 RepID=A0A6G1KU84_9PEZI|nr:hypothetical protein EJ03DRAFT_392198 [Teratosphaeria nubilosa]